MILFVAPNPHLVKEREGFLQRVAAIDALFPKQKKIYYDDIHEEAQLAKDLIAADVIYVHSIYNANKILKCYPDFAHKIITDLHGVVPEEEIYADNLEAAKVMEVTEREVFRYGRYFVAVTQAMVDHFREKYDLGEDVSWVVLPIYNGAKQKAPKEKNATDTINVIYAGGDQNWQNVPLMVDAINNANSNYSFTILTHSPGSFSEINTEAMQRTEIKTVPSDTVADYYGRATLGFILRKDTLVNNVACPTKLIEYLCYGVVPVVLSEKIGDFKSLGYEYVTLEEFTSQNLTLERLKNAIEKNYQVYEKFVQQANDGKVTLIQIHDQIKKTKNKTNFYPEVVKLQLSEQGLANKVLRYEYQVEVYKHKITEYAEAVEYYRSLAEQNTVHKESSLEKISKIPKAVKRRLKRYFS